MGQKTGTAAPVEVERGDYFTNGTRLFYILDYGATGCEVEDAGTLLEISVGWEVVSEWRRVPRNGQPSKSDSN